MRHKQLSTIIGVSAVVGLIGFGAVRTLEFLDIPSREDLNKLVADYRNEGLPWTESELSPSKDLSDADNAEPYLQAAALGVSWDDVLQQKVAVEQDLIDPISAVSKSKVFLVTSEITSKTGKKSRREVVSPNLGLQPQTVFPTRSSKIPSFSSVTINGTANGGESGKATSNEGDKATFLATPIPNRKQRVSKDGTRDTTLAHEILDSVQPAFKAAIRASKCKVLDYHYDWDLGPAGQFGEIGDSKKLAIALTLDAELKILDGRLDAATEEYLATLRIAELANQEPSLEISMGACSIAESVYYSIERSASYINSDPVALSKLEAICEKRPLQVAVAGAVRGEAYTNLVVARNPAYRSLLPATNQSLAPISHSTVPDDPLGQALIASNLRFSIAAMRVAKRVSDDPLNAAIAIDKLENDLSRMQTYGGALQNSANLWSSFGYALERMETRRIAVQCLIKALIARKNMVRLRTVADVPGTWIDPFSKEPLVMKFAFEGYAPTDGFEILSPSSDILPLPAKSTRKKPKRSGQGPVVASYPPQPPDGSQPRYPLRTYLEFNQLNDFQRRFILGYNSPPGAPGSNPYGFPGSYAPPANSQTRQH